MKQQLTQCPDEFQIEQHFNQIGHKTTYSGFNVDELDSKYKFTYPYQKMEQEVVKQIPQEQNLQEQNPNQNQRIIYIKRTQQHEEVKVRTIRDFKIDKAFIKPVKKKKVPQPQNQNIKIPIKILPMNCKYKQPDESVSQIKSVFEMSFHQEPKLNKFHELLNRPTVNPEIQENRTITWYGKNELCEGTLNGRVVQYFKTPTINVII